MRKGSVGRCKYKLNNTDKGNSKYNLKKLTTVGLIVTMMLQIIVPVINTSFASNYDMLGSKEALGSPILNPDFVIDDWNKWEMLTWGIFLSNFATPLVDDYDSTFNSNATNGSRGSGYKALRFGSGSDPANEGVIKELLHYAIHQQKEAGLQEIYVSFSELERDKLKKSGEVVRDFTNEDNNEDDGEEITEEVTSINESDIRLATFKDFFLSNKKDDGDSWVCIDDISGSFGAKAFLINIERDTPVEQVTEQASTDDWYLPIKTISKASLPTFYIKYGSGYEKIFDYTNGWDAQVLTAWISRVVTGDFKGEFTDVFNDLWQNGENTRLYLDCFGNIVVQYKGSRRILMPASINQHLTKSPKINLISSMIFNGYHSGLSGNQLSLIGRQSESGILGTNFASGVKLGGSPALGSHLTNVPVGLTLLYYDLDTIMYDTHFRGGEAAYGERGKSYDTPFGGEAVYEDAYKTHYGKSLIQLFDLDANKEYGNKYIFKLEVANMDKYDYSIFKDKDAKRCIQTMVEASGNLANIFNNSVEAKMLTGLIVNNKRVELFGEPVIVPVQMDGGLTDNKINRSGVGRLFINYIYDSYKNGVNNTIGRMSREEVSALMTSNGTESMKGFAEVMTGKDGGIVSKFLAGFIAEEDRLFKLNVDANKIIGEKITSTLSGINPFDSENPFKKIDNIKIDGKKAVNLKYNESKGSLSFFPGRLIKAYPISDVMRTVGNILGLRDGTEFSVYSTHIYITYLNWYGIKKNSITGEMQHDFNPRIFSGQEDVYNIDLGEIEGLTSEEDKQKEILKYTYLMLHPTVGKSYRNEIMRSYLDNFIYDTYQKIVYGNATSYYSNITSNLATRNAAGFLSLDSYSDNFMTAWFMNIYVDIAVILIGVSFILIIIVGILRRRKLTWYIIAFTVVINTILIVPSMGEVTPAVANRFVQKMFKNKMTYWGISEAVTNAKMESDSIQKSKLPSGFLSSLSQREQSQVVELVKTLNIVYLDRALMIKNDISKKVTQTQCGNYADVQRLRSARWLLPIIMRQFTANDGSDDYVYIPLGDTYDDLSNLYWLYKPEDAIAVDTINAKQDDGAVVVNEEEPLTVSERKSYYYDYKDTTSGVNVDEEGNEAGLYGIPYKSHAYSETIHTEDMPHTYSYILKSDAVPLSKVEGFGGKYEGSKSIDEYINNSIASGDTSVGFLSAATKLEIEAGKYDRFNRETVLQSYGYLWATENPYHYFYQLVKSNFNMNDSLGRVIGRLQGQYVRIDDSEEGEDGYEGEGEEVRTSFMHSLDTGYVRDVLDLEEMFTNMIPYLYSMQITAGGTDGKSGVLEDKKISEYEIYKNNYKSWLFRSNWVTKIVESPELSKPTIVKDSEGNRIKIQNPVLVDCYPENRPMIFSEAQMHNFGLHESDLSIIELKCIEINKKVSNRWTMLLNYASTPGMTKEVMFRQMATESLIAFNEELTPKGVFNSAYTMYPNGLELRAISFDTVMKMLMLNITKNTTYIYGDTMNSVINDSDVFSAALLLLAAFLCSYIIPLMRNIVMGLIFYLGFIAIIRALVSSNKQKVRVSAGYIISNILFLVITLVYYGVFNGLMAITTTDSVLSVQSVQVSTGNPVWCYIIITAIGTVYIAAMIRMINFCFKNYRDMGMEVYTSIASMITDKVSNGMSRLNDTISEYGSVVDSRIRGSRNTTGSDSGSGAGGGSGASGGSGGSGGEAQVALADISDLTEEIGERWDKIRSRKDTSKDKEYDNKVHNYGSMDYKDIGDSMDIDSEIEKGERMTDNKQDNKQDDE